MKSPSGRIVKGKIIEIKENIVIVDANHPLAGKTVVYDVMVVKIN